MAKRKKDSVGFNITGSTKGSSVGFNLVSGNAKTNLQTTDGKNFGEVSYDALKAVENGKLDKYVPKTNKEKKVLDDYKKHLSEQEKKKTVSKKDNKKIILTDYTPKGNAESKARYNRRRATTPSLPEFGSYEYFKSREEKLRPYMEEISKDPDRTDDQYKAYAENYGKDKNWTSKKGLLKQSEELYYKFKNQNDIIEQYNDINAQLEKFESKDVHFDSSGEVDTKSGKTEAEYTKKRQNIIVDATTFTNDEMVSGYLGELDKERQKAYDNVKVDAAKRDVSHEKIKAYDYYEKNKDKQYDDNLKGRFSGNAKIGRIGIKANDADYTSFVANKDDTVAAQIYERLSARIQENNKKTFINNTKSEEFVSLIGGYAPQAFDQMTERLKGEVIGAAMGYFSAGPAGVAFGRNLGGSATVANYMYKQTAGAAYGRALRESGLSVEDAKKLAEDEALASSAVEFGLEFGAGLLWKGVGKARNTVKGTAKEVVKDETANMSSKLTKKLVEKGISEKGARIIVNTAKNTGKLTMGALGEGAEEWIQSGISITADRYAKEGKTTSPFKLFINSFDLSKYSDEDLKQMSQDFLAGTVLGFVSSGTRAGTSYFTNKTISSVANAVDNKKLGSEILNSNTNAVKNIIALGKVSNSQETVKLATDIENALSNDRKSVSALQVGKLTKNVFSQISESTTDNQGHTPEQIQIIKQYEASVDNDLLNFIDYAKNNTKDNSKVYSISDVSNKVSENIKSLTGIDTTGWKHTIKTNSVRHIETRHGENGTSDHSMTDKDIARMAYVLDNYDTVEVVDDVSKEYRDKNQHPAPLIRFSKRIDGTYYVVEAVPDTQKHQLPVVAAYKNKAEQQTRDVQAPTRNVRNASADAFDNPIVSQDTEVVNTNIRNNSQNDTQKYLLTDAQKSDILTNKRYGLINDEYSNQLTTEEKNALDIFGKAVNVPIKIVPSLDNGRYDGKYDGIVYVALDCQNKIMAVFSHEVTHHFEKASPIAYSHYKQAVFEILQNEHGASKGAIVGAKIYAYAQKGEELSFADAEHEVVADYTRQFLSSPQEFMTALDKAKSITDKQKMNILQRMIAAIKNVIGKFTGKSNVPSEITATERAVNSLIDMIREAKFNYGTVSENIKAQYSMAGRNAKTANIETSSKAQELENSGATAEQIFAETGWFRGQDGKWRFEIDDSEAVFYNNPKLATKGNNEDGFYKIGTLSDILYHEELYKAYPFLENYTVIIQETESGVQGNTFPKEKQIALSDILFLNKKPNPDKKARIKEIEATPEYKEYNKFYTDEAYSNIAPEDWLKLEENARNTFFSSDLGKEYYNLNWGKTSYVTTFELTDNGKAVLMHEIQHAIQSYEGFARGASSEYWKRKKGVDNKTADELYQNTAGEIEARDVADRLDMTSEERRSTFPKSAKPNDNVVFAEDAEISDDIVILNNGNTYVSASRNVIKGNDISAWRNQIGDFFDRLLDKNNSLDIPTHDGNVLTITKKETANRARDNYVTENGKRKKLSKAEFKVKLNAVAHIDEIVETSINDKSGISSDTKNHNFAKDGFSYRTAYFEDFDGQYYKLRISVGHNGSIATVYNVGKIKKDSIPATTKIVAAVGSKPFGMLSGSTQASELTAPIADSYSKYASINNRISQNEPIVNTNIRKNSENDTEQHSVKGVLSLDEALNAETENTKAQYSVKDNSDNETVNIVPADVKNIQSIGRKSVNEFTSEDIKKSEKFARRYFKELGTKSPFFRAWFGDWRAYDTSRVGVLDINSIGNNQKGIVKNNDTGFDISIGSLGIKHIRIHLHNSKLSEHIISNLSNITENAVLLNTVISEPTSNTKHKNTMFMHELYAPVSFEGKTIICKLFVEEYYNDWNKNIQRRNYDISKITALEDADKVRENNLTPQEASNNTVTINSISDLFKIVKQKDKNFKPNPVNPELLNEDGTPKVVYHGTGNTFFEFDATRIGENYIQSEGGFFFTDDKAQAERYARIANDGQQGHVIGVYLNIKNPYVVNAPSTLKSADYFDMHRSEILNEADIVGNDGVIVKNENGEMLYVAFNPNQIKSATDNIGTYDGNNADIRYSVKGVLSLEEALKQYGAIPQGEIPARNVQVPKRISDTQPVSQFARTMMEAGVTPDSAISEFEQRIMDGTMTHEVITNEKAAQSAKDKIKELGFEGALNRWNELVAEGMIGKKQLALGMELYNQCITSKDTRNAMKIAADLVAEATNAGQTLQATQMLKRMSPDGQLYYLEKSIHKMNDEFRDKLGGKYKDIVPDEALFEEFLNALDEDARNEAYDKICQNIADQMPATMMDKWNSWRYLAMLGNPRTHIRNIAGNAVFLPATRIKNYVGAAIEKTAGIKTEDRTKSIHKSKEAIAFAQKDFLEMQKVLQGENAKYATTSDIDSKRTIFKSKWLELLRRKNFDFLEKEDLWFLKRHYTDALARLITVRKIDINNIPPNALDNMRAIAIREAQAATYRDANSIAEAISKVQHKAMNSDSKAARGAGILLEGVMPFRKTPMNIVKQGLNYSPAGILKGIYKGTVKLKNGQAYGATDVIEDFAKGLTGTGLMFLGLLMSSMGLIVGGDEEDKKKRTFNKMVGEQSYAIKVGDGSYTIDWMTPVCLPLFVGVELDRLTEDEFTVGQVTEAMSTLTEPLLELSVLSGVSDAISSAQYNDTTVLSSVASEMASSYVMQAFPTVGGQLSRIIDNNKRDYYFTDKNSQMPKLIQRMAGQMASKIPFASYLFTESVDNWGRGTKYGSLGERVLENFVSPGYYSKVDYTNVDKELQRLYGKTGDNKVLPVTQQKYFVSDGVYYYMTSKQFAETKRLRGQESFRLVEELIGSAEYRSMTDEEKVKAISRCYENAGKYAKEQMLDEVMGN